jgi:N-acetylmuramoyl-L-alanine amidase
MRHLINTVYLLLLAVLFCNCNRGPYAATNKQHKKQVKGFAKLLTQTPPADSLPQLAPQWVGTTNFQHAQAEFCGYTSYRPEQL